MKYSWPLWLAIAGGLLLVTTSQGFILRVDPMNMRETACTYFTGNGIATVYLVGEGSCSVLYKLKSVPRCPKSAALPTETCEAQS